MNIRFKNITNDVRKKIVYIAGPITGQLDTYRQVFADAERYLTQMGAIVLNPALLPIGLRSHESYMKICLPMLREADIVALLPGWRGSKGATIETNEAMWQAIPIIELQFVPSEPCCSADHGPLMAQMNAQLNDAPSGPPVHNSHLYMP